ncbi:BQ5605_C010g05933 [Microbotryum silenes-dioicae]|uniref:BQ5605_C010g05933 protein n=1 Tax=Microbotryum silenes-dioicae TaxID=796604 RepID=A0A2X0LQ61_9BASI|nr:BQ5605_C010g05933 [Microbotryum silenes-dioicae]
MDEADLSFLQLWGDKGSTSEGNITVTGHPAPVVLATIPISWLTSSEPTLDWRRVREIVQMSVVQPGYLCNEASEPIDMSTTPQPGAYLFVPLAPPSTSDPSANESTVCRRSSAAASRKAR